MSQVNQGSGEEVQQGYPTEPVSADLPGDCPQAATAGKFFHNKEA